MVLTFVHQCKWYAEEWRFKNFSVFFFLQNIDFPDMKDFKMIIFWRYLSVYVSTRLLFSIRLLHVILDIYLLGLVVLIKNGAFSRHSIALKEIHFPLIILDTLEWICIKSPPYDTLPLYLCLYDTYPLCYNIFKICPFFTTPYIFEWLLLAILKITPLLFRSKALGRTLQK